MKCTKCGANLVGDDPSFCAECGAPVQAPTAQVTPDPSSCAKCGARLVGDDPSFCAECGAPVQAAGEPKAQVPPAPPAPGSAPSGVTDPRRKGWVKSWLLWAAVGVVILAGIGVGLFFSVFQDMLDSEAKNKLADERAVELLADASAALEQAYVELGSGFVAQVGSDRLSGYEPTVDFAVVGAWLDEHMRAGSQTNALAAEREVGWGAYEEAGTPAYRVGTISESGRHFAASGYAGQRPQRLVCSLEEGRSEPLGLSDLARDLFGLAAPTPGEVGHDAVAESLLLEAVGAIDTTLDSGSGTLDEDTLTSEALAAEVPTVSFVGIDDLLWTPEQELSASDGLVLYMLREDEGLLLLTESESGLFFGANLRPGRDLWVITVSWEGSGSPSGEQDSTPAADAADAGSLHEDTVDLLASAIEAIDSAYTILGTLDMGTLTPSALAGFDDSIEFLPSSVELYEFWIASTAAGSDGQVDYYSPGVAGGTEYQVGTGSLAEDGYALVDYDVNLGCIQLVFITPQVGWVGAERLGDLAARLPGFQTRSNEQTQDDALAGELISMGLSSALEAYNDLGTFDAQVMTPEVLASGEASIEFLAGDLLPADAPDPLAAEHQVMYGVMGPGVLIVLTQSSSGTMFTGMLIEEEGAPTVVIFVASREIEGVSETNPYQVEE